MIPLEPSLRRARTAPHPLPPPNRRFPSFTHVAFPLCGCPALTSTASSLPPARFTPRDGAACAARAHAHQLQRNVNMLRTDWWGWLKSKSRAAMPRRPRPRSFRPVLESLEERALLSFAAPVSYNVGTQPDPFVPNAAPINVATADFNGDGK